MRTAYGYATQGPDSNLEPFGFERRDPGPDDVLSEILYCGIWRISGSMEAVTATGTQSLAPGTHSPPPTQNQQLKSEFLKRGCQEKHFPADGPPGQKVVVATSPCLR